MGGGLPMTRQSGLQVARQSVLKVEAKVQIYLDVKPNHLM